MRRLKLLQCLAPTISSRARQDTSCLALLCMIIDPVLYIVLSNCIIHTLFTYKSIRPVLTSLYQTFTYVKVLEANKAPKCAGAVVHS